MFLEIHISQQKNSMIMRMQKHENLSIDYSNHSMGNKMKKFQQVIQQTFEAVQLVRGMELDDFSVHAVSTKPLHITVWLNYIQERQVDCLEVNLKQGTTWELTALVAKWINAVNFHAIRESFKLWDELSSEVD